MRFRRSRVLCAIAFLSVFLLIWLKIHQDEPKFSHTCVHSVSYQSNLHSMAYRVSHVLHIIKLTHCLCYGSLWGQIRLSKNLPWESDVEFCILNEELSAFDENFVERLFRKHNLTLSYDSAEGIYTITDYNFQPDASIKLIVFERDIMIDMMRRVGWKRRMLPPICEDIVSLECFPARLMMQPLPLKDFGGKLLPVPREDIEILKYHYADNWWIEIIPLNC